MNNWRHSIENIGKKNRIIRSNLIINDSKKLNNKIKR